jgi:hypothetical protein
MPFDVWPDDVHRPAVAGRSKVAFTFATIVSGNRIGRRVLRRDLDELIAAGETISRADQPAPLEDDDDGQHRCDAQAFWGGA